MKITNIFKLWSILAVLFFMVLTTVQATENNLGNKRIALFFDKQFPTWSQPKSPEWFKKTLEGMGLRVTLVDGEKLSDEKLITRRNFDTIIVPGGTFIPFKADYTLAAFLAAGGNVIIGELPEQMKGYDEVKKLWNKIYRQDHYTRISSLQLRRCNTLGQKGKRPLDIQLKRNAQLPAELKARLPETAGPFAGKKFQVVDRMNNNYSEGNFGNDMVIAANIFFPVYTLPNGEKTDFLAYRYHNRSINGATLVLLGQTGNSMLNTAQADDVLYTALKLCELPFPGEQSAAYYERLFKSQLAVSKLSEEYVAAHAALSDAAATAFYQGKSGRYLELKNKLLELDKNFYGLLVENREADRLLETEKSYAEQDKIRGKILTSIPKQINWMKTIVRDSAKELSFIHRPEKVPVENPRFKNLRFDAALCNPIGYYMYRNYFFQGVKQLNVNTVSASWNHYWPEYLSDPVIKKNSEGLEFIAIFGDYGHYSKFDPVRKTIKEVKDGDRPSDNMQLKKRLTEFIKRWKDIPVFRFYFEDEIGGENGMSTLYWGKQAQADYHAYLTKKYSTVQNLNERWKANYSAFKDIPAPMSQPQAAAEHSNWEDWAVFRDQVYLQKQKCYYDTSKQYAPDIPVNGVMSITALWRPYFGGNNLYNFTKYQDVSGMDGTYMDVTPGEWTWFDLNRGIPCYSGEWGPFYNPPTDPRLWKNKLTEEIWAQLSGGALGINCRVWSCGGSTANLVDTTGSPTLAGWVLKRIIGQAEQIKHITLDGKRPADVRILYSNTCRRHDQSWNDGKTHHQSTVDNLYRMFMKWHRPARVLAEEALSEDKDIADCKLLLVPQAEYLKAETQEQLLDYVRQGGNVLIEGFSGKLDNYGQPCEKLFKAAKVECQAVTGEITAVINGEEITFQAGDVYRMVMGKTFTGKVLIRYKDKSPALISCQLGKGRLIFSGISFGLLNMNDDARRIIDVVNSDIGLISKYECLDSRLVLREWKYKGQTWLVCTYPSAHTGQLQECALKIRGPYKVLDYQLGEYVPMQTDGKSTIMSFVMPVPGMKIFRLDPLSGEQLAKVKTKTELGPVPEYRQAAAGLRKLHLPFRGFIYDGRPLAIDGYKIEVIVVSRGEADLLVSKGSAKVRQRILADKSYQFLSAEKGKKYSIRVGSDTLTIYSKAISDILPIGVDIEIYGIEKTASRESACLLKQADGLLSVQNGLIKIEANVDLGGRVTTFLDKKSNTNHVAFDKARKTGISETNGDYPGAISAAPFNCKIIKETDEEIVVRLKSREKVENREISKYFIMKKGESAWSEVFEANQEDGKSSLKLCFHGILAVGGGADFRDIFYVPLADGVKRIPFRSGTRSIKTLLPSKGWAAIVDSKQKLALISQFTPKEITGIDIFMADDFYVFELVAPPVLLEPGKTAKWTVRFMLIPGISSLDMVTDNLAAALHFSNAGKSGEREVPVTVELGSALSEEKSVHLELLLLKDGVRKVKIGKADEVISYDKPVKRSFIINPKDVGERGKYTLKLILTGSQRNIIGVIEKIYEY